MTDQGKQSSASAAAAPAKKKAKPKVVQVKAAGAGSVTIRNFAFSPGTINVKTGDSVTWTNQDSAPHTATGSGGSFNTGTLKKGQSGSHTFSKAGSFPYICAIHPNMKGTVVVAGASSSSGSGSGNSGSGSGSGSSGDSAGTGSSAGTGGGGSQLPNTGVDLLAVVLLGTVFTAGGALLRRLAASRG
jgi:plastocyanin